MEVKSKYKTSVIDALLSLVESRDVLPTKDSTGLVTSGGVQKALDPIIANVSELIRVNKIILISKSEYEQLVEDDEIDEDKIYFVYDEETEDYGKAIEELQQSIEIINGEMLKNTLSIAPTMRVEKDTAGEISHRIHVYHPLMNLENAELILMRYASKNGKKGRRAGNGKKIKKKGFCVASGPTHRVYFKFSPITTSDELFTFAEQYLDVGDKFPCRTFGIALRIPNPDYEGPATPLKNAIWGGKPESLYSTILRIMLAYDTNTRSWGLGLR